MTQAELDLFLEEVPKPLVKIVETRVTKRPQSGIDSE